MKRIGIVTSLYNFDKAYSICSVVENQLKALVKFGYKPILFVLPSFQDDDKVPAGVEIKKVIPQFILEPYHLALNKDVPPTFDEDVRRGVTAFEEHFKDLDIAITHDFILVDDYLPYAACIFKANLPNLKWFHWIHSLPSNRPTEIKSPWEVQFNVPPNSKIVLLNNVEVMRVAERYNGTINDVRVVHNPTDFRTFFKLDPLVEDMVDYFDLFKADIVQVYPLSSTRMVDGKQIHKVIKIFGYLKKLGWNVRLIVPNAHANATAEKDSIRNMLNLAQERGLTEKEVIFTSLIDAPKYESGVPHNIVRDLFLFSNLFIFPTVSENCPLILFEAALSKNLLVLNDDLPVLKDFFGKEALFFKFSSNYTQTTYDNEEGYYEDVAKIIVAEMSRTRSFGSFDKAKREYNFDHIFRTQMEPLFYEEDLKV